MAKTNPVGKSEHAYSVRDKRGGWPHRWGIAIGALWLIIYGSLLPFRFESARFSQSQSGTFPVTQFRATSAEDVVVNVLAYAALAGLLFHASRRRSLIGAFSIAMACTLLSVTLEYAQVMIPQRVSSGTDVALNVAGAILGLTASWLFCTRGPTLLLPLATECRRRPMACMAIAISSGLVAYGVAPFDFVTSTQQLHAAFHRIPVFHSAVTIPDLTGDLGLTSWFCVLGFLLAADFCAARRNRFDSLRGAASHAFLLACVIESLQLFTNSHVPELGPVLVRSLAGMLGAWTALFVFDDFAARIASPQAHLSGRLLLTAALLESLVYAVGVLDQQSRTASLSFRGWALPFHTLWLEPLGRAGVAAFNTLFAAGLLAGTLSAAFPQTGLPFSRYASDCLVVVLFTALEFASAIAQHRSFDSTNVLLALMGCALVRYGWQFLLPLVSTGSGRPLHPAQTWADA